MSEAPGGERGTAAPRVFTLVEESCTPHTSDPAHLQTTTGVTVNIYFADGVRLTATARHVGGPAVGGGHVRVTVPGGAAGPATDPGRPAGD